jgi:hypothetical protein
MYFSIREQARQIQTNHANQRRVNYKDIAGQCRTNLWPAVTEWPWCRNTDTWLTQMNTSENADAGLTFFRHSGISAFASKVIKVRFHHQQSVNVGVYPFPSTAGCEREGCIPFHQQQGVNVRVYPFPPPAGCEREGVFISTVNCVDTRVYHQCGRKGVSLSATSSFLLKRGRSFLDTAKLSGWTGQKAWTGSCNTVRRRAWEGITCFYKSCNLESRRQLNARKLPWRPFLKKSGQLLWSQYR